MMELSLFKDLVLADLGSSGFIEDGDPATDRIHAADTTVGVAKIVLETIGGPMDLTGAFEFCLNACVAED